MNTMILKFAFRIFAAIAIAILASGSVVSAQDASPSTECVAPALPDGTPTPLDENGMPVVEEGAASPADPVDGDMSGHDMETEESVASDDVASSAEDGLNNVIACLNSGDFLSLAALMTPKMIQWVTEFGTNPYDVPVMMEGVSPVEIVATGESVVDSSGRVGVEIVFRGLFAGPGTLLAERWYLIDDDGVWKLDSITGAQAPEGFMPEATIVEVQMVDFAFALSSNELPSGPVILRFSNTSYSHQGHVGVIVSLIEGLTAEQVIAADELPDDQMTGFFGSAYLDPGAVADLIFESLAPGTYTMACDIPTPDGVEHWKLGMVAQFNVV